MLKTAKGDNKKKANVKLLRGLQEDPSSFFEIESFDERVEICKDLFGHIAEIHIVHGFIFLYFVDMEEEGFMNENDIVDMLPDAIGDYLEDF